MEGIHFKVLLPTHNFRNGLIPFCRVHFLRDSDACGGPRAEESFRCHRLSFPVIAAVCRGRVVRVPAGTLVRVVGTELVIPCNVSDYDGPSEQNFDWSFSSSGSSFVELASTWEVGFPAQLYRERLQRGDILLRRTANDAVELHIKNVQPSDQGHYKCSTPSTDATVQGNYEDTVQVKGTVLTRGQPSSVILLLQRDCPLPVHCSGSVLPDDGQRVGQVTTESPVSFPSV